MKTEDVETVAHEPSQEEAPVKAKSDSDRKPHRTTFWHQFNALLRKNLVLQGRAKKTTICQAIFPVFLLLVLLAVTLLSKALTEKELVDSRNPGLSAMQGRFIGTYYNALIPFAEDTGVDAGDYNGASATTNRGAIRNVSWSQMNDRNNKPMRTLQAFQRYSSKADIDNYMFNIFGTANSIPMGFLFHRVNRSSGMDVTMYYNNTHGLASTNTGGATVGMDISGNLYVLVRSAARYLAGQMNGLYEIFTRNLPEKARMTYIDFVPFVEVTYYVWILHFLMPVFVEAIVYEREFKLRNVMRMMGLEMKTYWAVQYVFDWALYLIVLTVLLSFGNIMQFRWFTINAFGLYLVLFLIWGFTLTAMSFLFASVISATRAATIVSYFYIILAGIAGTVTIQMLDSEPGTSSGSYFFACLIPTFALTRAISNLSMAYMNNGSGLNFENANSDGYAVYECFAYLLIEAVIMYALAFYFEMVLPTGGGVKKHPLFLCLPETWCNKAREKKVAQVTRRASMLPEDEGEDVKAERKRVLKDIASEKRGLYLSGIRKVFKTGRSVELVAVRNLSLGVAEGECLGLLGHNGAGKTTTINMLSGLFSPTLGVASLSGFDLATEMSEIYTFMGVCPQHDVLWEEQTGREHLLFYGRLKGLSGPALLDAVEKSLVSVNLTKFQNARVKGYSGGMKRRLSVAIALIGSPKIVLLDEPTTGLDPHSRREVWEAITNLKAGRCIILTTHSMEEADALCDRIAIMSRGRLKCIGHSEELKTRFGSGYKLSLSTQTPARLKEIHEYVQHIFPTSELLDSLAGTSHFTISKDALGSMSSLFQKLEEGAREHGIDDWGISTATLDEVFVRLTRHDDSNEEIVK